MVRLLLGEVDPDQIGNRQLSNGVGESDDLPDNTGPQKMVAELVLTVLIRTAFNYIARSVGGVLVIFANVTLVGWSVISLLGCPRYNLTN